MRRKIGILFSSNENWIGGTYYILNLVSSFLSLDDSERPEVIVISWNINDAEIVKKTGYPYVSFLNLYIPYNFLEKILFKLFPEFTKKNVIKKYDRKQIDVLFPATTNDKFLNIENKIFWIADFQEHYYRDFFEESEIQQRQFSQIKIAGSTNNLILSSNSSKKDFEKFYPDHKCKTYVVNFAVTHPIYNQIDIENLKKKYHIVGKYFISPNQFWKHKNHKVVIDAVKLLKEKGIHVLLVFTGKEHDRRNPAYTDELKKYVQDSNLSEQILFLGFIDRSEQLQLMNNAEAVIQPSLFEGWSTVVEDAKAMNQYVIASYIDVHKEQLHENCSFFDPLNAVELADKIFEMQEMIIDRSNNHYSDKVKKFAEAFLGAIN
ncbi:MAG: glycosyltransferase family 1 protein [Bacteroidota bacterium]